MHQYYSPHSFHIPVMGLAYTIDTAIKVSKFGISSVMAIGEDKLIEMMRRHYAGIYNMPYTPIPAGSDDYRAKRITAYLNLVQEIVDIEFNILKHSDFVPDSPITKYFSMLPENCIESELYHEMLQLPDSDAKENARLRLRNMVVQGSIDVNILTKTDRDNYDKSGELIPDGSDAVAALRGYGNSKLRNSAIVFSAGMNPRLYGYLEKLPAFYPNESEVTKKRITIKVSDYRSALIQGKFLAKKGLWVSEFRIESGLNCGGHAFATDGYLLGPILDEFKTNRNELANILQEMYKSALAEKNEILSTNLPPIRITVQGGIGTHDEASFMHDYYGVAGTGWGTPFLLVPEATTVDSDTLTLLEEANHADVQLSHYSPLGVRFYYLNGTSAAKEKQARIDDDKPGSPCPEKHLAFNTEFTAKPICTASTTYQRLKIDQLKSESTNSDKLRSSIEEVTRKECLCVGLSNAASLKNQIPFIKNLKAVNICPGPNIVNFSKRVSLATMVDHIYGRINLISNKSRRHVFIKELYLYLDYLKELVIKEEEEISSDIKKSKFYRNFITNLNNGVAYYQHLFENENIGDGTIKNHLDHAKQVINQLHQSIFQPEPEMNL
ncbi:MAG: hypothetical protein IPN54_13860 [Bacteroidetes bacterium]|nr:hypothetical protein [Bacteroidota bacterium]